MGSLYEAARCMGGVHGAAANSTMRMRGACLEKAWHVSPVPRTSLNWSVGPASVYMAQRLTTVAPASEARIRLPAHFTACRLATVVCR